MRLLPTWVGIYKFKWTIGQCHHLGSWYLGSESKVDLIILESHQKQVSLRCIDNPIYAEDSTCLSNVRTRITNVLVGLFSDAVVEQ